MKKEDKKKKPLTPVARQNQKNAIINHYKEKRKQEKNIKLKRQARDEFRYNYKERHINYIFEEEGNKYHSLGITHKPKTFGKSNMQLDKNPQKNKNEKSHIRNGIITDWKSIYSFEKDNRFKFSASDKPKVKAKIRNYKKNRKK